MSNSAIAGKTNEVNTEHRIILTSGITDDRQTDKRWYQSDIHGHAIPSDSIQSSADVGRLSNVTSCSRNYRWCRPV